MLKIVLGPLDSQAARTIAQRRGITVDSLVSTLIREEAAIELTGWRVPHKATANQPQPATAGEVKRVCPST